MKHLLAFALAACLLLAVPLSGWTQVTDGDSQPSILSIRGKVVTVQVPEGFDSVTLQSLRRPAVATRTIPAPRPAWRTIDTQFPRGQAATLTFRLGKLTSARSLRVLGTRGAALPESYFTGRSQFGADLTGPLSGDSSTLWRDGKVSVDGNAPVSPATPSALGGEADAGREVVEADIWKIRGERLLYFNQLRGLQVFDLKNPDDPALLGTLRLPASGEDLYVLDDKYAVLLKRSAGWWDGWWFGGGFGGGIEFVPAVASSGVSLQLVPSRTSGESRENELIVAAYDQGAPSIVASLPFDGSLIESRLVGSVLYVATAVSREAPDAPDKAGSESGVEIVSFDLADAAHPVERARLFLPIYGAVITATDRFLFAAGYDWEEDASSIQVIDISSPNGAIAQRGALRVEGYVEDKFKMALNGDILSVASQSWTQTRGGGDDKPEANAPVTLLQTFSLAGAGNPVRLGGVAIAPGEWVRATRFDGTRAYVVTFEQIDPLHIVDLSDPAHPVVSGEVHVPGFSTYIEPLGDRLATIGLVNWRPTVSLFDVSVATAPRLLSQVKLGNPDSGWAESEAVWNEKAFKVLPEENLILLPVAGFDHTTDDFWGGSWFSRVQIIDLFRNSLAKRGIIEANFSPRRADLYGDRILAIAPSKLVTVNADNRDAPIVTAEVELAWRTDRVWRVSDYLLQLGGAVGWELSGAPTITVSPRLNPDQSLTVVDLPKLEVAGSALSDGVLYVAQRAWSRWWLDETKPESTADERLLVSAYDVSALPRVRLLSKANAPVSFASWSELSAVWPSPGTLVWVAEDRWRSWYRLDWETSGRRSPRLTVVSTQPNDGGGIAPTVAYLGGWTKKFIAFDVSTPEKISYASVVDFEGDVRGPFSPVFAADGLVFCSVFSPGTGWANARGREISADDGNRHKLTVVEYRDGRFPFVRDESVSLPGELRGIGSGGKLLFTLGPVQDPATDESSRYSRAVHVSAFDGLAAHLIDSRTVQGENVSLEVQGEDLFLLEEQPAYTWETFQFDATLDQRIFAPGESTPNPLKSELHRLRLDGGRLAVLSATELDHDAGLFAFGDLLVTQTAEHGVRLLDLSNLTECVDLGQAAFTGALWPNLNGADGALRDGLFIPLGDYGVETIDLAPQ